MSDMVDRRHPLTLVVTLAIIGTALGGAFYMMREANARMSGADDQEVVERIPVEVVSVARTSIPRIIKARGFLSGINEVTVHAEAAGKVVERPLEDGAAVRAGDVLLKIDETSYRLAMNRAQAERKRAEAQLEEARSGIAQAEAQLAAAKAVQANRADEFERIDKLYQDGNSPPIEYERVLTALHTADADAAASEASLQRVIGQRATAEALVAVAGSAVDDARTQLERCVVHSPIKGRVNMFYVDVGEYAIVTAPLVEVVQLDELKMTVAIDGREVPMLREFDWAEVSADAVADGVHGASLHHLSPKLDPISKKYLVELRVRNEDERLLSGMYGEAVIHCGELTDRIVVPRDAIFRHFGVEHCLVAKDTGDGLRAGLRRVQVRDVLGRLDELEITDGLDEGDQLIVTRRRELHADVLVQIVDEPQNLAGASHAD